MPDLALTLKAALFTLHSQETTASCEVLTVTTLHRPLQISRSLSLPPSSSSSYFLLQQPTHHFSFFFESSPLLSSYHSHLLVLLSPLPSIPSFWSMAPSLPFFPSSYPSFTGKVKHNNKRMGNK